MATQSYSTCALPEGLRYYLLRGDSTGGNVMVPLVPVDQLPFQLQGIPRQLTHRQISDGDWKLCSETNAIASSLLIQAPTVTSSPTRPVPASKSQYLAPDHHVRVEPQTIPAVDSRSPRLPHQPPVVVKLPGSPHPAPAVTSSLTNTFASIYQKDAHRLGYRVPHPSGIEPDPSKKEYCTHWIKTGECDWTAIGCKFKHEMPSVEKLRELGFVRGTPRWWREKSAIVARPPTWMERRLAGNHDAEQAGAMPEARKFPDPSTFRARKAGECDRLDQVVQQPRGVLKRTPSPEQTTVGRLTPPPAPVQAPVRRASQMSDLLIDLDDNPAPPPSSESSHTSVASTASSETQSPLSRTSTSPSPSPSLGYSPALPNKSAPLPKTIATKKIPEQEPTTRRHSQLSWASDTEDDIPMSTKPAPATKPAQPAPQRRKPAPRSTNRRPTTTPTASTKPQTGLAASKHARNTENHARNASRKVHGRVGGQIGAPELHTKIEQVKRDAHRKDRVGKGSVVRRAVDGKGVAV